MARPGRPRAQPGAQPWQVWGLRGASEAALTRPKNKDFRILKQAPATVATAPSGDQRSRSPDSSVSQQTGLLLFAQIGMFATET